MKKKLILEKIGVMPLTRRMPSSISCGRRRRRFNQFLRNRFLFRKLFVVAGKLQQQVRRGRVEAEQPCRFAHLADDPLEPLRRTGEEFCEQT